MSDAELDDVVADPPDESSDESQDERDPVQRRCEVAAALLVAAALASLVFGWGQSLALSLVREDSSDPQDLIETIEAASVGAVGAVGAVGGVGVPSAVLLLIAYFLIVLSPGRWIERLGTSVLTWLQWVALVIAVAGVGAVVAVSRHAGQIEFSANPFGESVGAPRDVQVVARTSSALPFVATAVLAAYAGWCARRTLKELPELVTDDSGEHEPEITG